MDTASKIKLIITIGCGLVIFVAAMGISEPAPRFLPMRAQLNEHTLPAEIRDRLFFSKVAQAIKETSQKEVQDSPECVKLIVDSRLMLITAGETGLGDLTKSLASDNCLK